MFGITSEQVGSAVRWAIGLGGVQIMSATGLSSGDLTSFAGAIATVAMIVWSLWIKRASAVGK